MRQLVECMIEWLAGHRSDANAHSLLLALTQETLKRADSPDPAQREFDAQALAAAAGRHEAVDFEASKRWVERSKVDTFAEARARDIEAHFLAAGHGQCLRPVKRSPGGKHRAVWFLEPYDLATVVEDAAGSAPPKTPVFDKQPVPVTYEFAPPGDVKPAWYTRPLVGAGSFVVRSPRGWLWAAVFLTLVLALVAGGLLVLGFTYIRRPVQTGDIASLLLLAALGWFLWHEFLRPMVWLIEDRIIPATELWVAWGQEIAQLELTKGADDKRRLQLVRYTAVCPLCAGNVELRYSRGPNRRRLVGCCSEAPHDHVFSFDRIRRSGQRIQVSSNA